ncbi:hypothetical protein [Roseomonas mucosa]|uniref:hypothetical protein n=1 Tax=Roseomonas mucosa TaxID=207340 RepID=UPI0022474216|nr:hypothetical protein [Roseomonas mucosa]UZO94784.1 Hypothetical protein RMP42_05851 [Roseomonas mucosa]
MIALIGKYLPAVEKQINRALNWDWFLGGWGTLEIGGWILAGVAGLWAYVYGKAEGQPITLVVTVAVALFAGVLFALHLLARLWSLRKTAGASGTAPAPAVAGTEPPLMMEFGSGPEFDAIDPHGGEATRRCVSFALHNTTDRFMTDVAVRFRSIVPKPLASVYQPGALLKEGIDIPPKQKRFVKLAYYDEVYPSGHVSPAIFLCTPMSPALSGGFGSLVIDDTTRSHEVVLETSGPDLSPVLERIILSVDRQRLFRLTRPS